MAEVATPRTVKAEVLRPFIGNYSDDDDKNKTRTGERRFSNAQGIIPRGFYHPWLRHMVKPHVIELTPDRFKELSGPDRNVVRLYDADLFKEQVARGKEQSLAALTKPVSKVITKGAK